MKKLWLNVCCVILVLCSVCGIVACNKNVNIDFPESYEDTAFLGQQYTIEVPVATTDGKSYPVETTVYDSKDKIVTPVDFMFTVTDLNGYRIVHTVSVGSTQKECVVTLKVTDNNAPNIMFDNADVGLVGEKLQLPTFEIVDNADSAPKHSVALFYVGADGEIDVTEKIEDGAFIPDEPGTYYYAVTAKDASGNFHTERKELFVIAAPENGEVNNVGAEYLLNNFASITKTYDTIKYHETFEGRNGVAELYYASYWWPQLRFKPRMEKAAYEEFTHFRMRMYIKAPDGNVTKMHFGLKNEAAVASSDVFANEWHDYIFPVQTFLDLYDAFATDDMAGQVYFDNQVNRYHDGEKPADPLTVYIDAIECFTPERTPMYEGEVESFADFTTAGSVVRVVGANGAFQENRWFDNLGGEQGVVRTQYAGEWPVFQITPRGAEADYSKYRDGYLAVKVYLPSGVVDEKFDETADAKTTAKITKINIGNRSVANSEVGPVAGCKVEYDKWITLYYDAEKFWTGGFGNAELLPGAVATSDNGVFGYVYFGEVYFINTIDFVLPGEVEHFGHTDSKELTQIVNVMNNEQQPMFEIGNVTTEWLSTYNGAKGVLKITWENTNGFGIKCATRSTRKENEDNYKNFAIRLYIDGNSTIQQEYEVNTVGLFGLRPFSVGGKNWGGVIVKDQWIDALWNEDGFSGRERFYNVDETFYLSFGAVGSGTVYIDNVWFY